MGTNYYFWSKNKELVKENFTDLNEYTIEDEPDFHYEIHLNKLSCGWRPLFQRHKAFSTFAELIEFYQIHDKSLEIRDEYDRVYSLEDYIKKIVDHGNRDPEPMKWVYEVSDFDKKFVKNPKPTLHTVECEPEEADLYIPFYHDEYTKTEWEASQKYHVYSHYISDRCSYSRDPEYPVDWVDDSFV